MIGTRNAQIISLKTLFVRNLIFYAYLVNRVIANFQKIAWMRTMYFGNDFLSYVLLLKIQKSVAALNKPIRSYQIHSLNNGLLEVWPLVHYFISGTDM